MTRRLILLFAALLVVPLLIVFAAPVYAGGWATVGVTEMPEVIVAGRPFTMTFMVWQHGNKPVHELSWDEGRVIAVRPMVSFGSAGAGRKLMFEAQPSEKIPGCFTVEIMLPEEGEYTWTIEPRPLAGVTEFEPLTVLPAGSGMAVQEAAVPSFTLAGASFPLWPAVALILVLAAIFLLFRTRRAANERP